jgi:hypothetical protein
VPSRALALLGVNVVGVGVCVVIAYASWHLFEKYWLALKMRPLFNFPDSSSPFNSADTTSSEIRPIPLRTIS